MAYFNIRSGHDVITDPYRGEFGAFGADWYDPTTWTETVNPQKDLRDAALAAGIDVTDKATYESYYWGVGQQGARDAMRDQRNAIGWAPAFEWSREYGSWYQAGSGWRFGLVYRKSDLPVEWRPVPQTSAQGGGSLVRLWSDAVIDGRTVPAGTVVRSCTTQVTLPDGTTVQVVGPSLPVEQPCPAGTGGCPADRPCAMTVEGLRVAKIRVKEFYRPQPPAPPPDQGLPGDEGYKTGGVAKPWYKKTSTWLIVGGVVVAGGIAVAVARKGKR